MGRKLSCLLLWCGGYANPFVVTCIAAGMGRAFSRICLFVCALKRKRLELSTPNLVHIYSIVVARHALTQRSKGQRSRSHGYENRHGRMVASDACCYNCVLLLLAWVCMSVWLLMFLVWSVSFCDSWMLVMCLTTMLTFHCQRLWGDSVSSLSWQRGSPIAFSTSSSTCNDSLLVYGWLVNEKLMYEDSIFACFSFYDLVTGLWFLVRVAAIARCTSLLQTE